MAYTPLAPFLPNGSIVTADHITHLDEGIVNARDEVRGYVNEVAVEIQAGQVTDAAFDAAVDRAITDGRLTVEGGGTAGPITVTETQPGVYEITGTTVTEVEPGLYQIGA